MVVGILGTVIKMDIKPQDTALILSGGGARAAYQVGVISAINELLPSHISLPFHIVCGTSAGAINAAALASYADSFDTGTRELKGIWENFEIDQVYHTGVMDLIKNSLPILSALFLGKSFQDKPVFLLNNSPLRELLAEKICFEKINQAIDASYLKAISITASSYRTSSSISFFQDAGSLQEWHRYKRFGKRVQFNLDYLMASSAIPFLFSPVEIEHDYYCDGAVRQSFPLSAALHLGAKRMLIIGVSNVQPSNMHASPAGGFPSLARVASHILNGAFLDMFEGDIEQLTKMNQLIETLSESQIENNPAFRKIDSLIISPSQAIDGIALEYVKQFPRSLRFLFRGTGVTKASGSSFASYLLFEKSYCRRLIELGFEDTMRVKDELIHFLVKD